MIQIKELEATFVYNVSRSTPWVSVGPTCSQIKMVPMTEKAEQSVTVPAAIEGGCEFILVVEDDDLVREFVLGQISSLGYKTLHAADGPTGLQIIRERPDIDLLFTDIVMPGGMTGLDLADEARTMRPELRILFTSAYTEAVLSGRTSVDRSLDLLQKPYRRQELAERLRKVLGQP